MKTKNKLISPHPLTSFKVQKYYQNRPRFNRVYSRDSLPKIVKDGACLTNLDVGTHWISLYVLNIEITYFDILVLKIFEKKFKNSLEIKT